MIRKKATKRIISLKSSSWSLKVWLIEKPEVILLVSKRWLIEKLEVILLVMVDREVQLT